MSDLPTGWEWTTLGEIAETTLGKMLDRGKFTGNNLVPYLRNLNVQWGRFDLSDVATMEIPQDQHEDFGLKPGDLLVCEGGEIGRCAVWPGSPNYFAFQKALHRIRPYYGVEAKYLRFTLEHLNNINLLASFATGSTIKHIPQQQLRRLPVPLAPSREQQNIVAALEDHLSRLDAGSEFTNTASRRIELLKRSLLNDYFSPREGVDTVNVGDVIADSKGGWSRSREHTVPAGSGVPYLKMQNITADGYLSTSDITWVLADSREREKYGLKVGDVLFNNKNSAELVGKTALVDNSVADWVFNENITRIRLQSRVIPEFFVRQLNSPRFKHILTSMLSASTNVAAIYTRDLRRAPFWLPDTDTQQRLINRFKSIDSLVRPARETLVRSKREHDHLRRSLLAEAFAGRLVTQDPKDEPASVLLERIRNQRATALKAKRTRSNARKIEEVTPAQETLP